MATKPLIEAWCALVVLSLATTLLTLVEMDGSLRMAVAGAILVLAGLKAHVILSRYLCLARSTFWMRGFDLATVLFLLLAFALFASASQG